VAKEPAGEALGQNKLALPLPRSESPKMLRIEEGLKKRKKLGEKKSLKCLRRILTD